MKIHFLGTCAGTEPMPDRKHTSIAVETGGRIYWFDAGEGCSYTAHLMGLDLLNIWKIVISHTHLDHIGGLENLLWNIKKLTWKNNKMPRSGGVEVYIPDMGAWEGIMKVLHHTGEFKTQFPVEAHLVEEGILFDDGVMKVTALGNMHIRPKEDGRCLSYSYLIECEGKRLVYSGDVGKYEELDVLLKGGCNGLIIETGHFSIDDVISYTSDKEIGRLFFNHNGREILNNPEVSEGKVRDYFGEKAIICRDGTTVAL